MSLKVQPIGPIPEDIAQVVRQTLPATDPLVVIGDRLSTFVSDESFADLYPAEGKPALSPALLAMGTQLQYWEFRSDRQAAHQVVRRLDWKYALHLSLTYAGFDYSVLSEFRQRLITHDAQARVFDQLLNALREAGLLKGKHVQRSDSLAILGAVRELSRLELAMETLRLALTELEAQDPAWLKAAVPSRWAETYGAWTQHERLVRHKGEAGRLEAEKLLQQAGADGQTLLEKLAQPDTPQPLTTAAPVAVLRRVWAQQFETQDGRVTPRAKAEACGAELIQTPHDPDLRYGRHGERQWDGYTAQWTETAAPDLPRIITDVALTPAGVADSQQLAGIQTRLAERDLLPEIHLADKGYISGDNLVSSAARGVQLVGPIRRDGSPQAHLPGGLTVADFQVDFEQQQAVCPAGQVASSWSERPDREGAQEIRIQFDDATCRACSLRAQCQPTQPQSGRSLQLRSSHAQIQQRRQEESTPAFKELYRHRSGVEASFSNAVHQHGARRARYRGTAKTGAQFLWLVSAINLKRAAAWLIGRRPRTQRRPGLRSLVAATT
jgi:transposase